eukprot:8768668-Lingulodinium_polyedra.AAC.1
MSRWRTWADEGIAALNELAALPDPGAASKGPALQQDVVASIARQYRDVGPPPEEFANVEGALR